MSSFLSSIFIFIGWEITRNLKEVMEDLAARGKKSDSMSTALKHMWAIIITLSLINLYSFLYSCVQKFSFGNYCNSDNAYVYNTSTIVNRLITYIFWVVPIIYVFWPSNLTFWCTRKGVFDEGRTQSSSEFKPSTLVEDEDQARWRSTKKGDSDDSDTDNEGAKLEPLLSMGPKGFKQ